MSQNPNEVPESGEVDQSEALKRAILKLREQGMLSHVPDDLLAQAGDLGSEESAEIKQEPVPKVEASPKRETLPEDVTYPATSRPQGKTVAATSDDVEHHAEERANWAAVMAGWEDTPSKAVKKIDTGSLEGRLDEKKVSPEPEPLTISESTTATQESQQIHVIEDKGSTQESQRVQVIKEDDWAVSTAAKKETTADEQAITLTRKEIKPQAAENALTSPREQTPWILQQFFDGEIDLDQELSKRFPTVPMLTSIKFRTMGSRSGRKVATLTSQDGSAQLIVDADTENKVVQLSFNYGSMMTLRYSLLSLSDTDRSRWLELMQREQGGLAFLWGSSRWQEDYLICVARKLATNIYAFSPRNFESAIRLSPTITKELLDWLDEIWKFVPEPPADDDSPLLTW